MNPHRSMPVLLVCHDVRCVNVLARMLRQDGFDVEVATDGAAAVARLGRSPLPSALVTDLWLHQIGGMAIARYARSLDATLPVILVTSHAPQAANVATKLSPSPTVLTKPFDYAVLRGELSRLVGDPSHAYPAVA
jgi:DNA-binding response OmpR family regulator